MRILSIDIGTKNSSFYIESFDESKITKQNFEKQGDREYWKLVDFTTPADDLFLNMFTFLDENRKIWDRCNGIIIEKQHKLNYRAQVLEHCIFGYFRNLYGPFKYISNISATRKTQILDAPKKMDKPKRKKWAIAEAHRILNERNDIDGLQILYKTKSDDLADSMLQLKAFQKLIFVMGQVP